MDKYLISLTYIENLGPVTLKKLLDIFGSPEAVWKASIFDLREQRVPQKIIDLLISERPKINPDIICEEIEKEGIGVASFFDDDFPKPLKEIYAPPLVLYYRGNLSIINHQPLLSVVGSRKISSYAKMAMPELLSEVVRYGVIIVSGLAYGVDGTAHQIALDNNGLTVGVLGSGLLWENFHPQSNLKLAQKILENSGLIISEFYPDICAQPFNFPRRNRIISGLSKAVLIIEASEKSGALITASYALEQNREVLAVPQNINSPNSAGVNNLIKNGAKLVTSTNDILETLNIYPLGQPLVKPPAVDLSSLTAEESIIYKLLCFSPLHIDKIVESCTLETSAVNSILLQMEMNGLIKNVGNQQYIKL